MQLAAAGLENVKGVILNGCAHWIFEENPDETLAAIGEFLATATPAGTPPDAAASSSPWRTRRSWGSRAAP